MEALQAGDPRQAGEFRLEARLGEGGMGRVFLGYSPAGRAVAVKICHPEIAADPAFVRRFALEVAAARSVNGVYTAQVLDAGPDDDPPWLATSYVPGPSLHEAVVAGGPLSGPAIWRLTAGLAEALRAVHDRGLVHRDLKPTNVLLAADGPRVIDFGVARALDGASMTTTGFTFGTPAYMSPEQVMGSPVGPASDVFALGCLLCFAATGGVPFGDGTPDVVLYRVVYTEPALDAMPADLRWLAAACLAKDPAGRPTLAQILHACQDRMPPLDGPGYGTGAFWPDPMATVILRHQASLSRETAALRRAGATPAASVASDAPAAPASPGTGYTPGRHGAGADGGGAGVSRRRLLGLAAGGVVAAAGLAAAGWELTRPGSAVPRTRTLGAGIPDRVAWVRTAGGPVSSGAVLADGVVYIGVEDGGIYAFAAGTGRPVRQFAGQGAVTAPLAVTGGTLLAARSAPAGQTGGQVAALAIGTGGRSWTQKVGGAVTGAPAAAGGAVYAGAHDRYVYALEAAGGRRIWRYRTGGSVQHAPVPGEGSFNDTVYAGSDDGSVYALGTGAGQLQWRLALGGRVSSGLLQNSDGEVFAGTSRGTLDSLLPLGDKQPLWTAKAGAAVRGTPAWSQQTIYFGTAGGQIRAIAMDTGAPIWTFRTAGAVASGLAVLGTALYAGDEAGYVYAIDITTARLRWRYKTGGAVRSQLLVADGLVYAGSQDHRVYALHA